MSTASMPFEYDEIDIPQLANAGGRPKEANPHSDIIEYLADNVGKPESEVGKPARRIVIPAVLTNGLVDEAATKKEVSKHVRWLREVGTNATPSYSVRTGPIQNATKGKGTKADPSIPVRVITFWIHTDKAGKPARIERNGSGRSK